MDRHFFPDARRRARGARGVRPRARRSGRRPDRVLGEHPGEGALQRGAPRRGPGLAERLGVGTTYHIASTVEEARRSSGDTGARRLRGSPSSDGLGSNLVLAHATAVSDEEVDHARATHDTKVAFCPGTSLKLAKGATAIGRYPEMMRAGVTVGLGTDGVSASGNLDLKRQMYLAAGLFKDARLDPNERRRQRALRMATIDGARALGMDRRSARSNRARRRTSSCSTSTMPSGRRTGSRCRRWCGRRARRASRQTWVDGRSAVRERTVTTVPDEAALRAEARERAARLIAAAGLDRPDVSLESTVYESSQFGDTS